MVNLVKKNIEVRIFPGKMDCNDNGEKIASINKIESNIGIRRFIYNEELEFINEFNAEINRINVEIMFENLRLIHTELRETYRQMKCK